MFCAFGPLKKILTDTGSHLNGDEIKEVVKLMQTRHKFSASYRPQTNGRVEQLNGTIVKGIRKMVENNKKTWNILLSSILYAYMTKTQKYTKLPSYEALFGVLPKVPGLDPLQELGNRSGMERLYYLVYKHINKEDK